MALTHDHRILERADVELLTTAFDRNDIPHVCYLSNVFTQNQRLEIARLERGTWLIEAFSINDEIPQVARAGFAFTENNEPAICYIDLEDQALKFSVRQEGGWSLPETIEAGLVGMVPGDVSLAIGADGIPHVTYFAGTPLPPDASPEVKLVHVPNEHLKLAIKNSTGWEIQSIRETGGVVGAGMQNSLALDGLHRPHIAFFNLSEQSLQYATPDLVETVDPIDGGSAGEHPSIVIDSQGFAHIAYRTSDGIGYAGRTADGWVTDTAIDPDLEGGTGWYTSLALDANDRPSLSFYDAERGQLKMAQKLETGDWETFVLADSGNTGGFSSIAIDSENHIGIGYFDFGNEELKFITSQQPLVVQHFSLIDAQTDLAIPGFDPISDGAVLDLELLPERLAIRAVLQGNTDRIEFQSGDVSHREDIPPGSESITLDETVSRQFLSAGEHQLTATPFVTEGGSPVADTPTTVSFTAVQIPSINSFTLIDASTDQLVPGFDPIPEGAVLDLELLPEQLNIRPSLREEVQSIRFAIEALGFTHVSNIEGPDAGTLGEAFSSSSIPLGDHILTATPFFASDAEGKAGTVATLSFRVVHVASINSFTLIDAATDQPVSGFDPIPEGAVLDLELLPEQLNIRSSFREEVQSIQFAIEDLGLTHIANITGPDTGTLGDAFSSTPIPLGDHILTATPFFITDAQGKAGTVASLPFRVVDVASINSFTLIDAATNQPVPGFDPIPEGALMDLELLPEQLNIRTSFREEVQSIRFAIEDLGFAHVANIEGSDSGTLGEAFSSSSIPLGNHTLTATPFFNRDTAGKAGTVASLSFRVVDVPSINSFTLIDAAIDQPVPGFDPLPEGAVLDLEILPEQLNIRTNARDEVQSLRFVLEDLGFTHVSNIEDPDFGTLGEAFSSSSIPLGDHVLTATPFFISDTEGKAGTVATLSIRVIHVPSINGFTLVDAATDQPVPVFDPIPNGAVLNLERLPERLNVRVDAREEVQSLQFVGALDHVENLEEGAVSGNLGEDFASEPMPLGDFNLTATPFFIRDAEGKAGTPADVFFTVIQLNFVRDFTLIDAQADQPIAGFDPIPEGAELDLALLPEALNIRANLKNEVGSVTFSFLDNDVFNLENTAPYSLFSDIGDDFLSGDMPLGMHTLTATPFALVNATGEEGESATLTFSVVRSAPE